jgi:HrpA-like RNA helicase
VRLLAVPYGRFSHLLFVPLLGQDEIETLAKTLQQKSKLLPPDALKLMPLQLYAALSPDAQMAVFEPAPAGTRKVILATNIAETSVTISGVRFVVDTGLAKTKRYNPRIGAASSGLRAAVLTAGLGRAGHSVCDAHFAGGRRAASRPCRS